MSEAITTALANTLPDALAPLLLLIVGVASVPISLFVEVNVYYFGMLPVLARVGEQVGITPEVMAKASLVGLTPIDLPLNPLTASFYLLVGVTGAGIGVQTRQCPPRVLLVSMVMLIAAISFDQVPYVA